MRILLVFAISGLVFGGASLALGWWLCEQQTVLQGCAAFGLSFVPAMATLAWVLFSYRSSPDMQLLASLGSSGLRMVIALGGALYLTQTQPQAFGDPLWYWLVLFYLTLLAFEIGLIVRQQPKVNEAPKS
jgi:hypothetical protein